MRNGWRRVCGLNEIEEEEVLRFDWGGKTFAVYHTPTGFYATDGLCTHEEQHLAEGMVIDDIIECPLHQGRFDIPSGKAKSAPVCIDLRTYPVKIENEDIYVQVLEPV